MLVPIVLATVCLTSSSILASYDKPYYEVEDAENLFNDFIKEHNKVYNRREYFERLEIFKETLKDINMRNDKFPDTVFAVNHFADLKPHELQRYNGFILPDYNITEGEFPDEWDDGLSAFDWRDNHTVTHVKNQLHCGSCYVFSAIGNIEGQYAIKHKQCLALSEGQAMDCLECGSCDGGFSHEVMKELAKRKKKLEKEEDYPYDDTDGTLKPCHEDVSKGVVQVMSSKEITLMDEEQIRIKLVNYGPISIALNAYDFFQYKEGILVPNICRGYIPNHAVLLVGYGEEKGIKFWTIKNSWGPDWGEKGYVRILRGVNACGIGTYLAMSTVE